MHVSLIVSVHDDAKYLARTVWSLSDAADYAASTGIITELVIVKDNPTPSIDPALMMCDFGAFAKVVQITVSAASLGPCRYAGVQAASGKYVALADADDLISYNSIRAMYEFAECAPEHTVVFPEWLFAFGSQYYLYRMFNRREVNSLSFFDHHPFISRVFLQRKFALEVPLADVPNRGPYAYEDWHHNCELVARGFNLLTCPDTLFFYRKKGVSMLSSVNLSSTRAIPPSTYHDAEAFIRACSHDYESHRKRASPVSSPPEEIFTEFVNSPGLLELCAAANYIDPAIDVRYVDSSNSFSNIKPDLRAGAAYFQICEALRYKRFTDVFLLPFFTIGGAELVVIDIIKALLVLDPCRRFLMLFGMQIAEHKWLDKLPDEVTTIDVNTLTEGADPEAIDLVTLRTIQTFAPKARLFFKSSEYAYRFYGRYKQLLDDYQTVMLRFGDGAYDVGGFPFTVGFDFVFLAEHGDALSRVIADNRFVLDGDQARLPYIAGKSHVVYSPSPIFSSVQTLDDRFRRLHNRILWASRLDAQKRPELLARIARALRTSFPSVRLEIWGAPILSSFDPACLTSQPNVDLRGPFSVFSDLPYAESDLFLYTSRFDGIPTVLLNALGAGLPIIAPAVGGIPEIIRHFETGLLIEASLCDEEMVAAYIDAIRQLRSSAEVRASMGRAGIELIESQHSREAHLKAVKQAFSEV